MFHKLRFKACAIFPATLISRLLWGCKQAAQFVMHGYYKLLILQSKIEQPLTDRHFLKSDTGGEPNYKEMRHIRDSTLGL